MSYKSNPSSVIINKLENEESPLDYFKSLIFKTKKYEKKKEEKPIPLGVFCPICEFNITSLSGMSERNITTTEDCTLSFTSSTFGHILGRGERV